MHLFRKLTTLLIVCAALFLLVACGEEPAPEPCVTHVDTDRDGKCDVCGADVEIPPERTALDLFKDGAACFRVVTTGEVGATVVERANAFVEAIRGMGITIADPVSDSAGTPSDCEILIGSSPANRPDDCNVDGRSLGKKGYLIKVVGDRVVIVGGSDEATVEAINYFSENYLLITEGATAPGKTTIKFDYVKEHESRYSITEFTLDGVDIASYTLVASKRDLGGKCFQYATTLRDGIYEYTGKWLEVVESDAGVAHPFYVLWSKDAGETGFRVANIGGKVAMECSYSNTFARSVNEFVTDQLQNGFGKMTLNAGESYTKNANKLFYSEFGAVNNTGLSESKYVDSFNAICAAHEEANKNGQSVCADDGWTYYIGATRKEVSIRTDVDWGTATFIVDDSVVDLSYKGYNLFNVDSDYSPYTYNTVQYGENYTLKKNAENVGFTLPFDAMLITNWSGHKVYVRKGANENSGADQQEVLLVDRDGNIDESTAVLWDYDGMDSIEVIRIDDKPLTIKGGTFLTLANKQPSDETYYARGILVRRSNTTIRDVKHLVQREGETGAPYVGFFSTEKTNGVVFDGITVTGHKTYNYLDTNVGMGSYDLISEYSNAVTWKNVKQSNSITNQNYWGVHASNFCKNLTLLDSSISRFDAHQGMYNCTIKNSTIGYALHAIGAGKFLCENVTRVAGESFIYLRDDYGSTWEGDVSLIDCKHEGYGKCYEDAPGSAVTSVVLIDGVYTRNHDFGYKCYLPQNVLIDNFDGPDCLIYVFWALPAMATTDKVNPVVMPKTVTVRNTACTIGISSNAKMFSDTVFTCEPIEK